MNVLLIYETQEGQTEKIARFIAANVESSGYTVSLIDAGTSVPIDLGTAQAVILAAPVHQRRHPRAFEALIVGLKEQLNRCKTMLLSVSLSAAFPEGREEAADYVTELKMRTGFEPTVELLVPGAVRTDVYDYFALQVVRHVVLRGKEYDPAAGSHEFTDWDALSAEISAFMKIVTDQVLDVQK